MKALIKNNTEWGGNYTDEYIENYPEFFIECEFTEVLPDENIVKKIWNGSMWIEGLTTQELEDYNKPKGPSQLPRMKFIIQVFIITGIMYEDIVLFIQNLTFDEAQKYVILTRLRSATHFDRNSNDLLTIAAMMGITSDQLDSIFINGNSLS